MEIILEIVDENGDIIGNEPLELTDEAVNKIEEFAKEHNMKFDDCLSTFLKKMIDDYAK